MWHVSWEGTLQATTNRLTPQRMKHSPGRIHPGDMVEPGEPETSEKGKSKEHLAAASCLRDRQKKPFHLAGLNGTSPPILDRVGLQDHPLLGQSKHPVAGSVPTETTISLAKGESCEWGMQREEALQFQR